MRNLFQIGGELYSINTAVYSTRKKETIREQGEEESYLAYYVNAVTSLHNNSYISAWVVFEGNSVEFSFPFFFLCNFISLFRLTSPIIQCQQPLILCQFKFMRVSIIYLQVIMYHIHNEHFQRKKKRSYGVKRPAVLHTKDRIKKSQFFRLEKEKNKIGK